MHVVARGLSFDGGCVGFLVLAVRGFCVDGCAVFGIHERRYV